LEQLLPLQQLAIIKTQNENSDSVVNVLIKQNYRYDVSVYFLTNTVILKDQEFVWYQRTTFASHTHKYFVIHNV
jgi:hypothetical protein